ncbi:hypothetical protein H4N58_02135 [Mumia sp. ZJ1417]|uniref:hypothetical protein n=1 Tax=Mumia sp. ZJ1417 TaxID=2708082 RepID=UPI00141EC1B5|nr:hypothetical protein [Mumia sp. ZJ1417]QMW66790.1 hypothetical protein H4N58_02135 [Mumia sp. ZJ1417]
MKTTPTRRGAGMIAAGALVAGALAALPVTAAQAAEATTTNYICSIPDLGFGGYDAKLSLNATAPTQVHQGQPVTVTAADVTWTWGNSWSDFARARAMQVKGVTAKVPVLVNGVALATPATLKVADADITVPAAGSVTWPASITFPAIPTSSGNDVSIALGAVDLSAEILLVPFTGGKFIGADIACALDGAVPTIATVDVLPPAALAPATALKATGKAVVGQRIVASGGTTNPASSVAYQWLVNGKAAGAGASYVVKPADLGKTVAVRSTATKVGYVTRVSNVSVGKVAAGSFAVKGKVAIKGKAKVGKKLTAKPGKAAGVKVSYQWLKNGKAIKGAKAKSLKLKKSFKGKKISVKVTYTKPGYKSVVQKSKAVKVKK